MTEGIIVALITCAGGLVATILTFVFQMRKLRSDNNARDEDNKRHQQEQFQALTKTTQDSIVNLEKSMNSRLESDRKEYMAEITKVRDSVSETIKTIADMKAEQQKLQACVELKIDALEKKQDVHNSVITRVFICEKDIEVLKNRESVSEHRLHDLEDESKKVGVS